jgi:uncharacterized protein
MNGKIMTDGELLPLARRVISEEFKRAGIEVLRIMLFGSRARGDGHPDSNWDFLVVIPRPVSRSAKVEAVLSVQRFFGKMLIPVDVMVKSVENIEAEKNDAGFMMGRVLAEGIVV